MKSGDHGNSHFDEEIAPVAPAAGAFLLAIIKTASAHLELGRKTKVRSHWLLVGTRTR